MRSRVRHEALTVAVREVVPAAGRRSGRSKLEAGRALGWGEAGSSHLPPRSYTRIHQ
jgi:hypothetical protein